MSMKFDGMERALNHFISEFAHRFVTVSWEWKNLDECQATLFVMGRGDEKPWEVPVVGDDADGGFDDVLSIDLPSNSVPMNLITLYEFLWNAAKEKIRG